MTKYNAITLKEDEYEELMDGCDTEDFCVVHEGEWVAVHKYEFKEVIVQHHRSAKYYSIGASRAGSYFTDYDYQYDLEAIEVEPVEVTTIQFKPVNN